MDKRPNTIIDIQSVIPSIVLDIRYCSVDNFVGVPIDGYLAPKVFLSIPACRAIEQAQSMLALFDLGIKIYDAYRPQMSVDHFIRWSQSEYNNEMKVIYYPELDKKELFNKGFIARQSSHSRASTVDITLIDLSSPSFHELDMGTAWDYFHPASWTYYKKLTHEQRANRMLLQQVMSRVGFRGLKQEWWHFTLEKEPFPDTYFNFPIE
ncbi:M15 family metallopeptidase [uncultured Shewanella sp.]|uniref:M15 family metallopeptidase n=1 Tax=uncultured Shewanella sp. TaxID=173975 RepID=UPI00263859DB|nr:M15 family metallopeptidase [uncultured Shewanella sp.]